MAAMGKQAVRDEWASHLLARSDPPFLALLESPHLLIGHPFADEKHQEKSGGDAVEERQGRFPPQPGLVNGRGEQPHDEHLPRSDKNQVQRLERHRADFLVYRGPAVVFTPLGEAALARVVVGQPQAPQRHQNCHEIEAGRGEIRIRRDDEAIDRRAQRPQSVSPGVLAGDYRGEPGQDRNHDAKIERRSVRRARERMVDEVQHGSGGPGACSVALTRLLLLQSG